MRRMIYQIGFVPSLQFVVGAHAVVVLLLRAARHRRRRGAVLGEENVLHLSIDHEIISHCIVCMGWPM